MRTDRQSQNNVNIQAKSIDLAVKNAAEALGVEPSDVEYELISRTDAGILSFLGSRKVEIRAWAKTSSSHRKAARPDNRRNESHEEEYDDSAIEKTPLSADELKNLIEDLRTFCKGICDYISPQETGVEAKLEDERLTLNIQSDYLAQQINKNPRLAESMEHILRKKPRYLKRELPFRIFIDANGIRADREQELVAMARDLSLKVAENKRPIVLNYKSSYDRKIIHMALDKDARVYTKSIGTGANRKLMILPIKDEGREANS